MKKPKTLEAPLELLSESPLNTRKTFDAKGLADLAASIAAEGVLQTLLCRPAAAPGHYEVLAGSRRLRAARTAAIESVPIRVRFDLGDDGDALEAIITENNQREDLPPLEEADGFAALLARGRDVATIAAKLGRSESYVRHRLRLVELVPAGRALLGRELLTLGAAMIVATLDAEGQVELLEELVEELGWDPLEDLVAGKEPAREHWMGVPSVAGARDLRAMMRGRSRELTRAAWSLDDATLSPTAGACSRCPKRTSAQGELFGDVGDRDACLDKACWDDKTERLWAIRRREAEEGGARVVEGAEAKKLAPYGHVAYEATLVDLDALVPLHYEEAPETDEAPTWRSVLGDVDPTNRTLIRAEDGTMIETVDRSVAAAAIAAAHPKTAKRLRGESNGSSSGSAKAKADQAKRAAKAKADQEARRRATAALVGAIEREPDLDVDQLRAVVSCAVSVARQDELTFICNRRELTVPKGQYSPDRAEAVILLSRDLGRGELLGLLVELVIAEPMSRGEWGADPLAVKEPVRTLLDEYRVDVAHVKREAAKAVKPAKKKTAAKKKATSKSAGAQA